MCNFRVGDLVQLKSGSPRMTVTDVTSTPARWEFGRQISPDRITVYVVWIIYGTSEVKRDHFDAAVLVPAKDERSSY